MMTLASTMVWLGEFDEGERWLRRTARALQTDTGPTSDCLCTLWRHVARLSRLPP